MRSRKVLIIGGAVFFAAIAILSLQLKDDQKTNQKLHISVRPVEAVPVTITSESGVIGTFNEPEIDITIITDIKNIVVSSKTYKDAGPIDVTFPAMNVFLEKKAGVGLEEEFFDTLSQGETIGLENGYEVQNLTEFEGGKWILGTLVTAEYESDGEQIVIERRGSENIILSAGTSIDREGLIRAGVPEAVIDEMVRLGYGE